MWLVTLPLAIGINLALFVPAAIWKSDKLTDLSYSLTFILLVLYTAYFFSPLQPQHLLQTGMILAWALRLMCYLLVRILVTGRDKRFDGVREHPGKFLKFWLLQAMSAWLILLPTLISLSKEGDSFQAGWQSLGLTVFAIGLFWETVADWQKFVFKRHVANKNKLIMSGLWRLSRHPNYFGEILVWVGVFVYASPMLSGIEWITLFSPVFIAYLLIKVSGIPPLEQSYSKRYGNNKEYLAYKENTSLLIPFIPKNILPKRYV